MSERTLPPDTAPGNGLMPSPARGKPRLVLQGVAKQWRSSDVPIFEGIDLELPPATVAVVVGRNGAGKTTLLRIAAGMITADAGTVELEGLSPLRNRRQYHKRVGFLSAGSTGLYPQLTVVQHLEYWARLAFVPPPERRARIAAAMTSFELDGIAGRRTDRLSMGQRQRLRLALAFLHGPSLLLLDEPWNSLDGEGIELVNATVKEFGASGGSALVCTPTGHELDTAPASRVYVLENGKLAKM